MNAAEDGPKRTVRAAVVKVLRHRRSDRGMRLEPFASRCVSPGEVHELVTTTIRDERAGTRIDEVGFLGFAEMLCAGVIDRGDLVRIGDRVVGSVLGFDSCHFPNHLNILIAVDAIATGADLHAVPETPVAFEQDQPERRSAAPAGHRA